MMTVGETPFTGDEYTLAEYGLPKNKELNMLFHFEIMDLDSPPELMLKRKKWKLSELKSIIGKWQNLKRDEGFWNTSVVCAIHSALWLIYARIQHLPRKP
jgi:oligo-1,6-glucosidase